MGKYRKLVAAVVGLGALLVTEFLGWSLPFPVDDAPEHHRLETDYPDY